MTAFINEFHYDNVGGDAGEFIEIAAPAGFDLNGWSIVLYNGTNGTTYNTLDLTGLTVTDAGAGFGFALITLPANGLQNGSPDGFALVDDNGAVQEFLSYEGAFAAVDGPAAGLTSTDIGATETGTTAIGQSLQRQGTGSEAADFVFARPLAETPGAVNEGQSFGAVAPVLPSLIINEVLADPAADLAGDANGDGTRDATQDEFVEIINSGDFDADLSGITISDGVSVRHIFAEGTMLAAGEALVVFGGGIPAGDFGGAQVFTASSGSLGLNNGGDTVTLATADGDVIAELTFGGEGGNNQSLTRDPDETGDFVQHTDATGAEGALFSPGTQVDGTSFAVSEPVFTINEVDADQESTDSAEFIELYDGGAGNSSLDGLVVVLFNGSSDSSYDAIDLTGQTTDENGFFVIGSADVPNVDLVAFGTNGIQNGADAVALYTGTAAAFPNGTAVTADNLIDAIVYGTNDTDDTGLLGTLGQDTQYNESANGLQDTESNSRVPDGEGAFVAQLATPGETNFTEVDPTEPEFVFVHDIQGSSAGVTKVGLDDRSALEGQAVTIEAIVTAEFLTSGLNGFYVQEEDSDQDADVSTSEGLFVFAGSADVVGLSLGDLVSVTGTVSENFGETQISAVNVGVISTGNALPTTTLVELGAMGAIQDDDAGIDYVTNLEAYEGMLVEFTNTLTISEMFNLDRFGEYGVSADGRSTQFTQDNAPDVAGYDAHLQEVAATSILLDDGVTAQNPTEIQIIDGNNGVLDANDSFRMGDTLDGVSGVVAYGFDEFRIFEAEGTYTLSNPRPETPEDVGGNFKVASLNVLNFFTTIDLDGVATDTGLDPRGADSDSEFDRQLTKAVAAIVEIDADVLGLVEVENADDSTAIAALVDAVNTELGSDVYDYINTGIVGGDAITNGIIYKTDSVNLVGEHAILEEFNGRDFIDPLDAGRPLNRPAVAQTFEDADSGETFTIAVNHLKSKGSVSGLEADNAQGDGQANNNATRTEAVDILAEWLASDPTGTGAEQQMILGDLNAYAQEDPITTLEGLGFTNVASDTDYSFVFDGQIGTLDYILINDALLDNFEGATEWHINADEADAIDYNLDFGRDPALFNGDTAARNSDHDPILAGFTFEAEPLNVVEDSTGRDYLIGTAENDIFAFMGGFGDAAIGAGGDDQFDFSVNLANGTRDNTRIFDWSDGDLIIGIDADDVALSTLRETETAIRFAYGDDNDVLTITGDLSGGFTSLFGVDQIV